MKRLLLLIIALCLALPAGALGYSPPAHEFDHTFGGFGYVLLPDGSAEIRSYHGRDTTLAIPDRLDGHAVAAIGRNAFARNEVVKTIILPEGVRRIGQDAFRHCSALETVVLPASLTEVDGNPFIESARLTTIIAHERSPFTVANGVLIHHGDQRLICCPEGLTQTRLVIPDGVRVIGENAFRGNATVAEIIFPASLRAIDSFAFTMCSRPTSVTLPEGLQEIGPYAFCGCDALTEVILPETLTLIDECAFQSMSALERIVIPEGVTTIGWSAFGYCEHLADVTLPASLTEMDDEAFRGCPFSP